MGIASRVSLALGMAAVVTCGVLAQVPAAPQQPPSTKGIIPKGKAPVSNQVLQVKLPRAQEADLPNGLHVMVIEDRRAPLVTFQIIVPGAGGYFDPAEQAGLAQFTAALLREGTTTRTSQQISEQLERLAATLNASAGMSQEEATISGSSLTEHVDAVLDLAGDILLNPTFPEQELERYKVRTRAQLIQQRSQPGALANERFLRVIAGDHPEGRFSPTVAVLDKTARDGLAAFHKAHYVPDYAAIAFVGDISMAEAMGKVQARFGPWKKAGAPRPQAADPAAVNRPGVYLVARPNSVQTNLIVGAQAIHRTDPDYYALTVLNKIVGGGPTGRLFRHLREDKGYTYGAYSNLLAPAYRGLWMASTEVRSEVTEAALGDLLDELKQVRETPVPEKEFADAKRAIVAAFALELESPQSVLGNAITRWRYGFPADYWDRYPERIMAVTTADVQAMAKKYLDPERVQTVAVGNADAIGDGLKKFGNVEVYDIEGKKLDGK